jgi:hypothetical protein
MRLGQAHGSHAMRATNKLTGGKHEGRRGLDLR